MIEGTDIFEYFLCPYKVYNRHNRDRSLMIPLSDFTKGLMENGRNHEKELVSHIVVSRPRFLIGDFTKGFLQTFKLMQIGTDNIYQGVLKEKDYLGIPDLLIKQEGKSNLGKFHYIPADIKSSTRSKDEQVMQLFFYDFILEKIQGFSAKKGILILKSTSEVIDLNKYEEKFAKALKKVKELSKGLDFGLHIDSVCKECSWRGVCYPLADKTKDVSLVYGLSRPVHYKIAEMGIKTLLDLKKADSKELSEFAGVREESILKWKKQANVLLTKKDSITKITLPETKNHICLDIETSEDGSLYLIGLWHKNKFKYFFSDKDEKKIVDEFVEYVLALDDYILYHYGVFEKTAFRQLFNKYNIDENIRKEIFKRMVDIFQLVKKNTVLPLTYYNLKAVAKNFGFKWRSKDASGSNSMLWYNEWIKNKDKKMLKKILEYNEDDVKATYIVLKKLSKDKV